MNNKELIGRADNLTLDTNKFSSQLQSKKLQQFPKIAEKVLNDDRLSLAVNLLDKRSLTANPNFSGLSLVAKALISVHIRIDLASISINKSVGHQSLVDLSSVEVQAVHQSLDDSASV
ncbi:hypothetical protein ACH5RR_037077 [Cinchona calisaya]|uniref:Uncharacterized protein n=1 Tax=Cinchona calisaya TaxID=153742 RepID=A0ABD2Y6C9_9GENT